MVSFEEFAKLDLRVAQIIEAQPVEGAAKLFRLRITLGSEERMLMAGIAQHYTPEQLKGKRIVVVANLEPRKIRGVESQGMLLAAVSEEQEIVSVVSPDKDNVPLGAKVT